MIARSPRVPRDQLRAASSRSLRLRCTVASPNIEAGSTTSRPPIGWGTVGRSRELKEREAYEDDRRNLNRPCPRRGVRGAASALGARRAAERGTGRAALFDPHGAG